MFKRSYRKNIGLMAGVEFFAFLGITSFWILFLSQNGMSGRLAFWKVSFMPLASFVRFLQGCWRIVFPTRPIFI